MKASELRDKNEQELRDELLALRREQFNLCRQASMSPESVRGAQIAGVRKNIARVKTVMNEKRGDVA